MFTQKNKITAILSIYAIALAGCTTTSPVVRDYVRVEGAVGQEQSIEITDDGLRLRDAIGLAGTINVADDDFVAIDRGRTSYYIPLIVVINDRLAGQIPLVAGDKVRVVNRKFTTLATGRVVDKPEVSFRVIGLTSKPNTHIVSSGTPIIHVIEKDPYGNDGKSTLIVLTRVNRSQGSIEQFLIPTAKPFLVNSILIPAIWHNDVIELTHLNRVPLIAGGVIASHVRDQKPRAATQSSLSSLRQKIKSPLGLTAPISSGIDGIRRISGSIIERVPVVNSLPTILQDE